MPVFLFPIFNPTDQHYAPALCSMARFLLSLAYRVFGSPFAAWVLLAITLVNVGTALLKGATRLLLPAALGPDALRGLFQLSFFAFIPLSVYLALSEYRWLYMAERRHPVNRWPMRTCIGALILWLLVLLALFGYDLLVFPRPTG
jgi:hypothetical protein